MRNYFLVLLAVIAAAYAVQFDISPGGIRCFTDQFDKGEIISGNVNVQGLTQMQLQFWVRAIIWSASSKIFFIILE